MINLDVKVNFEKYADGLVPAIIQDSETNKVLMLGFIANMHLPGHWQPEK